MDTRALRYFQAVAEFGSYSDGAKVLRISQPAVSRQIRALEDELGRKLFIRHSHGVSLTDAGRILLERAQAILRQFDQAKAEIRGGQDGPSGTVTLAVPPAAGSVLVPSVLKRLGAAFPNVFPKVTAGFSSYTYEWLLRGRVDLACLHDPTPQPGFVLTPLVNEEVFLVLPGRPNASRRLLDTWLSREGVELDVRAEADDHLIIRSLLDAGLGFSLLTQSSFRAENAAGRLQAWPLRPRAFWQLALVELPADRRTGLAAGLADLVRAAARELLRTKAWPGGSACS